MNHSVTESGTADNQEPLFSETFRKKSDSDAKENGKAKAHHETKKVSETEADC